MPRLEVRPFEESDLEVAGRLLAERHRRHRRAVPLLPADYEQASAAEAEVAELAKLDDASGFLAARGGEAVGFLLGAPRPDPVWGPNVWVEAAGQASKDPEAMRDLYASAAQRWVEDARKAHYVMVPASDEALIRAWFRLGFGQQQAYGVRSLPSGPAPPPPPGITIRRPTREDVPVLAQLDLELPAHQGRAPTLSAGTVSSFEEAVAEWEDDIDDDDYATFLAEHHGRVVGSLVGTAVEKSNTHKGLLRPVGAALLGFAAVFRSARGLGAGRALGERFLAWAAEAGFSCAVTDWRVTNLTSSRAWPALGFEESFLRLHRLIGY